MSIVPVRAIVVCDGPGCDANERFLFVEHFGGLVLRRRSLIAAGWHDQPNASKHFCPACKAAALKQEAEDDAANDDDESPSV